jgi:hypothetical protein
VLHLDHINGDAGDDRLKNLRFLCPNCHQQTATWGNKRSRLPPVEQLLEMMKTMDNKAIAKKYGVDPSVVSYRTARFFYA